MDGKHKVFISYSRNDMEWLNRLNIHLKRLNRDGDIDIWSDQKINSGENWRDEIEKALSTATFAVLLLSADFFGSDFIVKYELPTLLNKARNNGTTILPIIISACNYDKTVLSEFASVNDPKKPILGITKNEQEEIFAKVSDQIENTLRMPSLNTLSSINNNIETVTQRRFVHTKISSKGLLELEHYSNPYSEFYEPTDPQGLSALSTVYSFAWIPETQYIKSSLLHPLTPVAAICTVDPNKIINAFTKSVDTNIINKTYMQPYKLGKQEKETIIIAMAESLSESFLLGGSISSLVLGVGSTNSKIAYQAITNMFLLPLLQMHRKQGFKQFNLRLSHVGEESDSLLSYSKAAVRASFPQKNSSSVDFLNEKDDYFLLVRMAHFLAWAVGAFYNDRTPHWVQLLEEGIQKKSRTLST